MKLLSYLLFGLLAGAVSVIASLSFTKTTLIAQVNAATASCNSDQILICHQLGNDSYNTPCASMTGDAGGHDGHSGDIIPPFDYPAQGNDPAGHYDGKNWDTQGQAIYNNGCTVPGVTSTPTQTPTATPSPTPQPTATPTPTATPSPTPTPEAGVTSTPTPTPGQVLGTTTGGPGDGLSDGRSDGLSSCPSCTAAPSGNVLGVSTEGQVLGASTDVLGATGSNYQMIRLLIAVSSALSIFMLGRTFVRGNETV